MKKTVLHDALYDLMSNYALIRDEVELTQNYKNPYKDTISRAIPASIRNLCNITPPYVVQGSWGKGRWTIVPWVAVFDSRITTSAQKGVYIVILLNKDTKELYLTLNQGATEGVSNPYQIEPSFR